jgi:hypothetical protein
VSGALPLETCSAHNNQEGVIFSKLGWLCPVQYVFLATLPKLHPGLSCCE